MDGDKFGMYKSTVLQIGKVTGPGNPNGVAFDRDDGALANIGAGNRVLLFVTPFFTDLNIFSEAAFSFMGIELGWTLTNVNPDNPSQQVSVRTFEFNSQITDGPFGKRLYIEPAITIANNPTYGDSKLAKMNWDMLELPYDNPNVAPAGSPGGYGVNGLVVPLIARGDYLRAWLRVEANGAWSGFSVDDVIQLDALVGADAQ